MFLLLCLLLLSSMGDAIHLPSSSNKPVGHPGVAQPYAQQGVVESEVQQGVVQSEVQPGVVQSEVQQGVVQSEVQQGVVQSEVQPGVVQSEVQQGVVESEEQQGAVQSEVQQGLVKTIAQPVAAQQAVQVTVKDTRSSMYAFTASLTSQTVVSDEGNIVFDRVHTNVGGLYFNTSGQFFCPDDGIYVFSWTNQKASGTPENMQCITALRQAGIDRKYGPKTSYYSTTYSGVTSMTSVMQCTLGTAVTVISKPWSDAIPSTSFNGNNHNLFSGFKLHSSIAFTVELSKDLYVFDGSKVVFDDILYDFGGHFDVILGVFRCPDDGIYVFSVSAHTTDPTTPWSVSRLMKDGEVVVLGPITYIATASHDSGSNSITVVAQCDAGNSIYVETQAAHDFPHNSYAPKLTSFTGFKLFNASDPTTVAFTAVLANNHTALADGLPLPMEQVIINVGNAYDSFQSAFVCPDDDYYMFIWSATANYGGGSSHIGLYMDNSLVTDIYLIRQGSDDATGTSGTASMSAVAKCLTGSRFQLRVRFVTGYVYLAGYTHFSGFKLPGVY